MLAVALVRAKTFGSMSRIAVVFAVVAATVATAHAAPTSDDPVKSAAAANKPLVLEFYASWCGLCEQFAKQVLVLPEVQTAVRDVMFVRHDAEESPGRESAARYRVDRYPTFIVVDRHGAEVFRRQGLPDKQAFLELLRVARQRTVK